MSFLKISDPTKRELIVKEYLETKQKKIFGIIYSVREPENNNYKPKFYKPITETQKATTRDITEGLRPIKEGTDNLPQAITFPAYPSITAYDKPSKDTEFVGQIAAHYLRKFAT